MFTPNGKNRLMTGVAVKKLPHWKYCTAYHQEWHTPRYVRFQLPTVLDGDKVFVLRNDDGGRSLYERWQQTKAEVQHNKALVVNYQQRVRDHMDTMASLRLGVITEMKARKNNVPDMRFTYENIKAVLLENEHIIDVRMPGEQTPDYRGFGPYKVPVLIYEGYIMVTFTGAVIYDPLVEDGNVVGIPTPPISMWFNINGTVVGHGVCAHPHMAHGGGCLGDAQEMLQAAVSVGNIFAAVDIMQEYRIGHSSTERGRGQWERKAWDFWCHNEAHGWPETEPFQKPWIAAGRPVYVGITGQTMPVYEWLQVADREEAMQAFHLGLSTVWYNPIAMKEQLATAQVYEKNTGNDYCVCGRPFLSMNDNVSLCVCHTTGGRTCSGCGYGEPNKCVCVADLPSWTTFEGATYCYAGAHYTSAIVQEDGTTTTPRMYKMKEELYGLLPRGIACEPCLLRGVPDIEQ